MSAEAVIHPNIATSAPGELLKPRRVARGKWRVFAFFSVAIAFTGIASLLFADLLWRTGWSASRTLLLCLFSILYFFTAVGCVHGIYGFVLRRLRSRGASQLARDPGIDISQTSTALVFPIYNEDVQRVFAGIQAVYQSLATTGHINRFDFFVLSDSTDPSKWVEEERAWFDIARRLDALDRIFYRRRSSNEGKKSGNIRDFLSVWGQRYRYFIVFDADSVMNGRTIVELVKLMEANPTAGLIQTAPSLVNGRTVFARMQQFANRLYGPLFNAGLSHWAQEGGNYWGHNAIIRVEPFMQWCDLPKLPGSKPFGGHILSHDFVEAALLGKANWQVWFAHDLEGSYEESPPSIIDNAQRDRRWCQGNLQHFMVLFARGLRGVSRIHLAQGICCYLAGPLWLLFLVTGTYLLWYKERTGLSEIIVGAFTPYLKMSATGHALLVFGLVMTTIFLPKLLSLADLALDPERRRTFGGMLRTSFSAFLETLFSTFHAPLQMLFHTKFVAATLSGAEVHWGPQKRVADGLAWSQAISQHWGHTTLGALWGAGLWWLDERAFWWFTPVLAGLLLSIPLSVFTSREGIGNWFRRHGLFITPEESETPGPLAQLHTLLEPSSTQALTDADHGGGLRAVVLDPYLNALHIALLREREENPLGANCCAIRDLDGDQMRALAERLLTEGANALSRAEQVAILSHPRILAWLHREAWMRPSTELAEDWDRWIRRSAPIHPQVA